MESSQLVSWQFENFSTAELSPPTSPASPSSPLFYHDGSNPSSPSGAFKSLNNAGTMLSAQSQKPSLSSVLSSRAQTASNALFELEQLHSVEQQSDAFGMKFGEESVDLNMNLFEELADIEFTPPIVSSHEDSFKAFEVPSVPLSPNTMTPSNDKLSAEFKSIVESLTNTTTSVSPPAIPTVATTTVANNVVTLNDLIQITGIPTTTVVGNECLIPVEFIGRPSTTVGDLGPEEAESMDLDGIIISNDMALINESELFSLEQLSSELITEDSSNHSTDDNSTIVNGVLPYWAKDMTVPLDELDTAMNKNDETLNALLQGDVSTAKNVIAPDLHSQQQVFSPISTASVDNNIVLEEAEVIEVIEKPAPKKKTERRGRKPSKKDSLNYVKDKALRKKEQNKTAATRYRQKKKQELAVTLAEEEELQTVHDELQKEKEKVGAELRMVRSLLRDMLQARKQKAPSVSSSRLTASAIVQAQKIANRRK